MLTEGFRELQERWKKQREPRNPLQGTFTAQAVWPSGHRTTARSLERRGVAGQGPKPGQSPASQSPLWTGTRGDALGPVADGCQRSETGPPAVLASCWPGGGVGGRYLAPKGVPGPAARAWNTKCAGIGVIDSKNQALDVIRSASTVRVNNHTKK